MYKRQCLLCGKRVGNYIPYREIPDPDAIGDFDYELENRTYQLRNEWFQAAQAAKREAWWAEYQAYLDTDEWRERRRAVLERDHYLCQSCLTAKATIVHHLTYAHLFNEPLFDLVSVCEDCHRMLHGRDQ